MLMRSLPIEISQRSYLYIAISCSMRQFRPLTSSDVSSCQPIPAGSVDEVRRSRRSRSDSRVAGRGTDHRILLARRIAWLIPSPVSGDQR